MSLLAVENITKTYEGVKALDGVSTEVRKGTIKGLIGPNGAGKSTLFHLISGIERPDSGRIRFKETEITGWRPHEIALLGLGRTFQTIQTWGNMTVVDNILAGMHRRLEGGFLQCGLWLPKIRKQEKRALTEAKEILELLGLLGRWEWPASHLSFGEQKMLEMGRVLAMKPELLLLDEPASGLTPLEVQQLSETIRRLSRQGLTFLIIEHRLELLELADEIVVLHNGRRIAEGPLSQLQKEDEVVEAYLGNRGGHA